jgi:Zn-dependent M28 family amino/carboxypeptidase
VLAKFARDALDRTVRFIAFGNEEIGLIGAREWVKAYKDELPQIRFMLNLDSAGRKKCKGIVLNQVKAFLANEASLEIMRVREELEKLYTQKRGG